MKLSVLIVSPPGHVHAEAFREVAETLHQGLLELGHDSRLTTSPGELQGRVIVLGTNLLVAHPIDLPPDAILYNLEHVTPGSPWFRPAWLEILASRRVWDYDRHNVAELARLGITRASHAPIGYVEQLTRIAPAATEDVDVLFYGTLNGRRAVVLSELVKRGLVIRTLHGVYGAERDAWIARAKIVLNVHYHESRLLELVRLSYLLANGRFVVSETAADPEEEARLAPGVVFASYDALAETCVAWRDRPEERRRVASAGLELMRSRPVAPILERLLREA